MIRERGAVENWRRVYVDVSSRSIKSRVHFIVQLQLLSYCTTLLLLPLICIQELKAVGQIRLQRNEACLSANELKHAGCLS